MNYSLAKQYEESSAEVPLTMVIMLLLYVLDYKLLKGLVILQCIIAPGLVS